MKMFFFHDTKVAWALPFTQKINIVTISVSFLKRNIPNHRK